MENVLLKDKRFSADGQKITRDYTTSCGDNAVLDCSQPPEDHLQSILREEDEIVVTSLKKGKSSGIADIPVELVHAARETMIDVLTQI